MTNLAIRDRKDTDLAALAHILQEVHVNDHWPKCRPASWQDWLIVANENKAWVVESKGVAVGHISVATPPPSSAMIKSWQAATKLNSDGLIEITRFFISPNFRGRGGARLLFKTAIEQAKAMHLAPVLYTGEIDLSAQRLYEASGWTKVGEIPELLPDGSTMVMLAYVRNIDVARQ